MNISCELHACLSTTFWIKWNCEFFSIVWGVYNLGVVDIHTKTYIQIIQSNMTVKWHAYWQVGRRCDQKMYLVKKKHMHRSRRLDATSAVLIFLFPQYVMQWFLAKVVLDILISFPQAMFSWIVFFFLFKTPNDLCLF